MIFISFYLENKTLPTDAILRFRFANYTMFISEMNYFTVSELDLKGKNTLHITLDKMWPIFEPTKIGMCQFDLPSFDISSTSIYINIGKKSGFYL